MSESPGHHPSKRQKLYRACAQCVTAKTRCEDVMDEGCSVCRKRKKFCSLAIPTNGSSKQPRNHEEEHHNSRIPASVTPATCLVVDQQLSQKMKESELRIILLEQQIRDLQSIAQENKEYPTISLQLEPQHNHNGRPQSQRFLGYGEARQHITPKYIESFLGPSIITQTPSLIRSGMISEDQAEMIFQTFKHKFSKLFPFPLFLSSTTTLPDKNLLLLAMIHFLPSMITLIGDVEKLVEHLNKAIMMVLSGKADTADTVLALFVLSLTPVLKQERRSSRYGPTDSPVISPATFISLALQVSRNIGLELEVRNLLEISTRAAKLQRSQVEKIQLYAAVVNQYMLIHALVSQDHVMPATCSNQFPSYSESTITQCTSRLQTDHELLERVRPALGMQESIRKDWSSLNLTEVQERLADYQDMLRDIERYDPAGSAITDIHKRALQYSLILRFVMLCQEIPSPMLPLKTLLLGQMHSYGETTQLFLNSIFPEKRQPQPEYSNIYGISNYNSPRNVLTPTSNPPTTASSPSPQIDLHTSNARLTVPSQQPSRIPIENPFDQLPAYISNLALTAIRSLRSSAAHLRQIEPYREFQFLDMPLIFRVEEALKGLGGAYCFILEEMEIELGPWQVDLEPKEQPLLPSPSTRTNQSHQISGLSSEENSVNMDYQRNADDNANLDWMGDPNLSRIFDFDLFGWDYGLLQPPN